MEQERREGAAPPPPPRASAVGCSSLLAKRAGKTVGKKGRRRTPIEKAGIGQNVRDAGNRGIRGHQGGDLDTQPKVRRPLPCALSPARQKRTPFRSDRRRREEGKLTSSRQRRTPPRSQRPRPPERRRAAACSGKRTARFCSHWRGMRGRRGSPAFRRGGGGSLFPPPAPALRGGGSGGRFPPLIGFFPIRPRAILT